MQKKRVLYDKDEDQHYDTISAFIKSVRGSDPDSALYWLAKMIEAGEDPRFIARRLIILASEDIGLADPQGLVVAVAALHAVEFIGMPEGQDSPRRGDALSRLRGEEQLRPWRASATRCEAVQKGEVVQVPTLSARRPLSRRETARPRRGLPVQPRFSRRHRAATLRHRTGPLLPAHRPRLRSQDQGPPGRVGETAGEWQKKRNGDCVRPAEAQMEQSGTKSFRLSVARGTRAQMAVAAIKQSGVLPRRRPVRLKSSAARLRLDAHRRE